MQKKREICEYRDKLDKTLSSPDLTNQETLKSLLRKQVSSSQECNENILDRRTADVSKLLSKLRSVSMKDHHGNSDWKLKHDLEDCRVMYREGLEGSPFHIMLVEGYMDASLSKTVCAFRGNQLFKFSFPPFRILQSTCLQKDGNVNGKTHGEIRRQFCISPEVKQALGTLDRVIYMVRNITPVQEAEEFSPNRAED